MLAKVNLLFLLICIIFAAQCVHNEAEYNLLFRIGIWRSWKALFQKRYTKKLEELSRMRVFLKNFDFIRTHNRKYREGLVTYAVRINEFSDLTPEEFAERYHCLERSTEKISRIPFAYFRKQNEPTPDSLDWRLKGLVTPVKDQKQCGSCWAFSSTGSLEGQVAMKTGKLISLSEQQLVDCSKRFGNDGCDGGLMTHAFEYILNSGIETEEDYNYTAKDGACKYDRKKVAAKITGYLSVPSKNERQLQLAVANVGPISVAIDASDEGFMSYSHGVYTSQNCSKEQLNHAVLLVGYDQKNGSLYWTVKNSWGQRWGMDGYILIARNQENMCGIATMASYPVI